jgi:hypothetical protein
VAKRGLDAEEVTIFLKIPLGTKFVSATGNGFKGVRPLAQLGLEPATPNTPGRFDPSGKLPEREKPDLSGDVAVWEIPRIAAAEKQTYTLTLSGPMAQIYTIPGPGPSGQAFKGLEGSTVYWAKPGVRMVLRCFRTVISGCRIRAITWPYRQSRSSGVDRSCLRHSIGTTTIPPQRGCSSSHRHPA